jgi:site-specific recombinase XerD
MTDIIPLKSLEKRVEHYAKSALSTKTRKCYETDWRLFNNFCQTHDLEAFPSNPETICLYITEMADFGLSVSTIVRRMTSITAIHEAGGHLTPVKDASVARVLQGIKRENGQPPDCRKAISWIQLKRMVDKCDSSIIGLRDAAILALGWSSALRRSELVALNIGDLDFMEKGLIVTVRRSKTDKIGKGAKIGIPRSPEKFSGEKFSGEKFCPVSIVERWINRLSEKSLSSSFCMTPEEPLFVKLGIMSKGKWWSESLGRLPSRSVSKIVKTYSKYAGMEYKLYAAHSLRRGLATEAGSRGVPERIISRHTRHRSVRVLRGYIEDGTIWEENPLPTIYSSSSSVPGFK